MTLLKMLVALLALANVGFFLWVHDIRGGDAAAAPQAATLRLASEVPGGATPTVPPAPGPAQGAAPSVPADSAAGAGSAAGPGSAGAPGSAAGGSALLTNVRRCVSVGPFPDVAQAAHAASTLRSGGYDPRQRVSEGEVWAGIWVYLPVPAAHAAGEQLLARLKSAGVEDALEMPGPNDGSVISLGLFSETKRAQARVAQVQALGFNPALADRKRNGDVYWIDIDLKPTDAMLKPADLTGETGRIVRLEVKGCPSAGASP